MLLLLLPLEEVVGPLLAGQEATRMGADLLVAGPSLGSAGEHTVMGRIGSGASPVVLVAALRKDSLEAVVCWPVRMAEEA